MAVVALACAGAVQSSVEMEGFFLFERLMVTVLAMCIKDIGMVTDRKTERADETTMPHTYSLSLFCLCCSLFSYQRDS